MQHPTEDALDRTEELAIEHATLDAYYDLGLIYEDGCPLPRPYRAPIAWASSFYEAMYNCMYAVAYEDVCAELRN